MNDRPDVLNWQVLQKIYRLPVDLLEQLTTGAADNVLVNSKFTADVSAPSSALC